MSRVKVFRSITQRSKSKSPTCRERPSTPAIVTSAPGIHLRPGNAMIQSLLGSALVAVFLLQGPALDSASPKERQAAIEQMAVLGNSSAIPALTDAYKKEPKADLRAEIVAGLSRIHDKAAIPAITNALRTDVDKDVRLQ